MIARLRQFAGIDGLATLLLSLAVILVSGGTSLLASFLFVRGVARRTAPVPAQGAERIIVLGMKLVEGKPAPAYRQRLDRSYRLASRQPMARVFLLGGRTGGDGMSEAEAGKAYLIRSGLDAAILHTEDLSRHTLENLRNYRANDPEAATAVTHLVTSRFHLARSGMMAAGLGIRHALCAAEEHYGGTAALLLPLLREAFFVHWYVTGRLYATLTRNRRMLDRIS